MPIFTRIIDFITLGSDRPMRRLVAYYAVLVAVGALLVWLFPPVAQLLAGGRVDAGVGGGQLLQSALSKNLPVSLIAPGSLLELATMSTLALAGTLALMLPVSWVYMSARRSSGHQQSVAQSLIILPLVIAGVIFIVRDSLALALSLAGVVAAVRFRTTLRDARDSVFIFLAIAVGFAAGVQLLAVGALLSVIFNFVLLLSWRYDFGGNLLEPAPSTQWTEPLESLATHNGNAQVRDRDLVLALTPRKASVLADRFERVRDVIGTKKKKPRYNALLTVTSDDVGRAQAVTERVLEGTVKRWKLDEVVTNTGKPSELYFLVRLRKAMGPDDVITAIRSRAGALITSAHFDMASTIATGS